MKLALQHHIGGAEALFGVAQLVLDMAGDVAPGAGILAAGEPFALEMRTQGFVDHRGVRPHSVIQRQHRLQDFVVHINQRQRLLRDMGAGSGNRGDGVALIERFLMRHNVFGHQPDIALGFGQVNDLILDDRKILSGQHRQHAGQGFGAAGVDRPDAGMSIRAAQHLAVKHTRQLDIGAVFGRPRDFVNPVVPDRPGADNLVVGGA